MARPVLTMGSPKTNNGLEKDPLPKPVPAHNCVYGKIPEILPPSKNPNQYAFV